MGVRTVGMGALEKPNASPSVTRSSPSNFTVKRTHDWLLSDVPSDITVEAGGTTFNLHKFPLVSRSGRILKQVKESKEKVDLQDMPGGAEAFEMAAKFCYGINLEITASNVATLRCAASYLEMTDEYTSGSLETRTEAYLTEIVLHSLMDTVTVLATCENENMLPFAEDLKITTRCIDAIAAAACNHQLSAGLSRLGGAAPTTDSQQSQASWWGKELTALNVHMFQRVVTAMRARGVGGELIAGVLMHYARGRLHPATAGARPGRARAPGLMSPLEREQRTVAETVVGLLPGGSAAASVPVSFLSWLLRESALLGAAGSCRTELERRIGAQLSRATLDDLLVPSIADSHNGVFDIDVVLRILTNFVRHETADAQHADDELTASAGESESEGEGDGGAMSAISKLLDAYLAEVAPDPTLSLHKFIALAEVLPDTARTVSDGLYRAVDIFLKAHPNIKDIERSRVCRLIDCKKLSPEASAHAAQNDRLPVQVAVQVLYYEQLRLRNAINGGSCMPLPLDNYYPRHHHHHHHYPPPMGGVRSGAPSTAISPRDNYASVRRENRELKLEVARMRMRLSDLEKDHVSMKQELVKAATSPHGKLFQSFSRKINSLFRPSKHSSTHGVSSLGNVHSHPFLSRRQRHSIS